MELLTPRILKWRDDILVMGIREAEFWDMTVGEVSRVFDAYLRQMRDRAYMSYTNARAVGAFIGSMLSGKNVPTIHDIYPDLFDEEKQQEREDEAREAASAANFLKFANNFNRRYGTENGDGKSESENNG